MGSIILLCKLSAITNQMLNKCACGDVTTAPAWISNTAAGA